MKNLLIGINDAWAKINAQFISIASCVSVWCDKEKDNEAKR